MGTALRSTVVCLCIVLGARGVQAQAAPHVGTDAPLASPQAMDHIAQSHFQLGNEYFGLRRFAEAAREFQQAYAITQQSELLFNIGRAEEEAGELQAALEQYQRYDEAGAPGIGRDVLHQRMETLRVRIASAVVPSRRGRTRVVVRRLEYHLGVGHAVLPPLLLGAGLATGAVAGVIGGLLNAANVQLETANRGAVAWSTTFDGVFRIAQTRATLAWALGAAGGGLVLVSIVWFAARGPGDRNEVPVAMPSPVPGGWMLTVAGRM